MEKEGTEDQIVKLRWLRSKLGMNRTVFARDMGIPLRTVEEWEAGQRKMPDYLLKFLMYYALGRKVLFKNRDKEYMEMLREVEGEIKEG
ncbi:MAG: hypothetical protein IJ857_07025 [Lachnospiraceae bacterium]|nr:hypothetical protein [Lachnospiraceae bacterium]